MQKALATPYGDVGLRGESSSCADSGAFPKISEEQAKYILSGVF